MTAGLARIAAGSLAVLVACGGRGGGGRGEPAPDDAHAIAQPLVSMPDQQLEDIYATLRRIELAVLRDDPSVLAGAIAPGYTEVACGAARRFEAPADAAAARIRRGAGRGWRVSIASDGVTAWAISTETEPVNLEVLRREPEGWRLVAGGVSAQAMPCSAPAGSTPVVAPERSPAAFGLAGDAVRVWCGRWSGNDTATPWDAVDDEVVAKLDTDRDGIDDFTQSGAGAAGGPMSWVIGERSLAIVEERFAGPAIAASLVSSAEPCTPPTRRGRTIVTDREVEIIDRFYFAANSAEIAPSQTLMLDALATTLANNPGIRLVAVQAYADRDEDDPLAISERRGLAVRAGLHARGVANERMEVHFYSDAPDAEPRERRRAQMLILKRE